MELRTMLRRAAAEFAPREAIVDGERRLTFAEAWSRALRLANALGDAGLRPGDRIATLEDNSLEAADIYLAAAAGNFVRVPLYPRNRREAHRHMIGNTGCRLALIGARYIHEVEGLDAQLPALERILPRDESYEAWLARYPDTDPDPAVSPEDYCLIRHTGGTSGLPKGVAYRHRTWLSIGEGFCEMGPYPVAGDAVLHAGSLAHGSGYFFAPFWSVGARNVMMRAFDPCLAIDLLERERISHAFLAPTMLAAIAEREDAYGRTFPYLKFILSASAPISERTARQSYELFGDAMHTGYGQTEALPITALRPSEWFGTLEGSEPLRSVGRPMAAVELEIRDAEGKALPVGEEGEIVVRIPDRQMEGIWNDEAETARRMADGWVRTGDVGKLDANGLLYLLDRANDMIVSGGFNLYPAEIENTIAEHPLVREVAVFGVPHPKWGETPLARVVHAPGAPITEREIVDFVAARIGSLKKPGQVILTTEPLPVSNVGKIMRAKLREPYWVGHGRRISGA